MSVCILNECITSVCVYHKIKESECSGSDCRYIRDVVRTAKAGSAKTR
jgi:hypothetical protein